MAHEPSYLNPVPSLDTAVRVFGGSQNPLFAALGCGQPYPRLAYTQFETSWGQHEAEGPPCPRSEQKEHQNLQKGAPQLACTKKKARTHQLSTWQHYETCPASNSVSLLVPKWALDRRRGMANSMASQKVGSKHPDRGMQTRCGGRAGNSL